jgi:hypothetical protein
VKNYRYAFFLTFLFLVFSVVISAIIIANIERQGYENGKRETLDSLRTANAIQSAK